MSKLLIVDDDMPFARVLARAMSARGYDVSTRHTVADTETEAQVFQPDFVLLDLNLNGENGAELIPKLKAASPDCTIVVLSSYGDIRSAVWAARQGAADFVSKPADADELDHLLKRAANLRTTLPEVLSSPEEAREAHIVEFFEKNDRRVALTARLLGMHRRTLQRILARLGLDGNGGQFAINATPVGRAKRIMRLWSVVLAKRRMPKRLGSQPGLRQSWVSPR